MYALQATTTYETSRDKVIGSEEILKKRLRNTLEKLRLNPANPSLNSHRINTDWGVKWSSWITGDMRLIWDYNTEQRLVIILVAVGTHSGTHKVYK